jgi:hypothetical protein
MLRHPQWAPAHALLLVGAVLVAYGLVLAQRDERFAALVGAPLLWAIVASVVWCSEGVFHLMAWRDEGALMSGGPTPILTTHLVLAVIGYPAFNVPLALVAAKLGTGRPLLLKPLAWLGFLGSLALCDLGPDRRSVAGRDLLVPVSLGSHPHIHLADRRGVRGEPVSAR